MNILYPVWNSSTSVVWADSFHHQKALLRNVTIRPGRTSSADKWQVAASSLPEQKLHISSSKSTHIGKDSGAIDNHVWAW